MHRIIDGTLIYICLRIYMFMLLIHSLFEIMILWNVVIFHAVFLWTINGMEFLIVILFLFLFFFRRKS